MADADNDHDYRALSPPRSLSAWERRAIDRIMTWPTTPTELRAAMRHVEVDAECRLCPSVWLTLPEDQKRLVDREGRLAYAVAPGELQSGAGGTRTHVLLHILEGVPIELNLYRDDGEPVAMRPDVEAMILTEVL